MMPFGMAKVQFGSVHLSAGSTMNVFPRFAFFALPFFAAAYLLGNTRVISSVVCKALLFSAHALLENGRLHVREVKVNIASVEAENNDACSAAGQLVVGLALWVDCDSE